MKTYTLTWKSLSCGVFPRLYSETSFVPRRYFIVYDCRDLNAVYLGRVVIVHTNDFDLGLFEVRDYLDRDPILKSACTWRVKEVDFSLIADFMEEC